MSQVTYRHGSAPHKPRGIISLLKRIVWTAYLAWCRCAGLWRTFLFQGKQYRYFYHSYNQTYRNERAVEIPIARALLEEYRNKKVLEVGNVLSHYFQVNHEVVDKYEKGPGVLNRDIAAYTSRKKYDLILCLSTLEHVGWDEVPRRPQKLLKAFRNIRALLAPGGKALCTFPMGANAYLDGLMKKNKLGFKKVSYLKRISRDDRWVEAGWQEVKGCRYEHPYPCANGLVIGMMRKD